MQPTTIATNGFAIRDLRMARGIAVELLALEVGVTRAYITKLELGHSRRMSPAKFNALVVALGPCDRRSLMADPYGEAVNGALNGAVA